MRTLLATLLACASACPVPALAQTPIPKVNDARLKIELVAEAPDIVTPIGIDVDDKGRIYVVESHTHFPPANYKLEKTDRIRVLEDTDGDRKADKISDFHSGETHTMGIAIYRDGSVYVATRKEVFRLRDTNNDGKSDERTPLVKLETKGNYPHNGLSGFAFDFKGDVYFGFGENLGETYKLIGSDGVTLEGGGEGGNIYNCDPAGKKLRRVATGFWNPFHLCFDTFGRLFAVDNDPDGRPPCRLLHIVEGGDYGYRFRYGRGGQHPFTSWNGEIPGTLPMISGTGEAPSGMLAYESDNLPDDYLGNLLVTSWGDHRIERYRLKPNGASFTSKMEPVITGGENFRPVGIALAPDGSLYISDWVDKSYNVHGKGRVWRLSAKEEKQAERPDPVKEPEKAILSKHRPTRERAARQLAHKQERARLTTIAKGGGDDRLVYTAGTALLTFGAMSDDVATALLFGSSEIVTLAVPVLRDKVFHVQLQQGAKWPQSFPLGLALALTATPNERFGLRAIHTDPFLLSAAVSSSARSEWFEAEFAKAPVTRDHKSNLFHEYPLQSRQFMLWGLLAQRASGHLKTRDYIPTYLLDADESIRFLAIQWIAEEKLTQYRKQLTDSLARPGTTPRLLVATLTALDMLDGTKTGSVDHVGGRWYLERLVFGDKTAPATRAMALRMLPADNPALTLDAIKKLLAVDDVKFRIEIVRTLRDSPHKGKAALLGELAADTKQPAPVRSEAVAGLDASDKDDAKLLLGLVLGEEGGPRDAAMLALRGVPAGDVRDDLVHYVQTDKLPTNDPAVHRMMDPNWKSAGHKDDETDKWLALVDGAKPQAADVSSGERVFFSAKAGGCYRCHTTQGRGGEAGPDLSTIGSALTRERLLESILQPGKEIAPRFAAQLIEKSDGEKLTLMYVGPSPDGRQIWADTNGKKHLIAPGDIESKQPLTTSIMPTGLHKNLLPTELRDLLAYLQSLK